MANRVLPEGVSADPKRLARFEREAKVLASLNHPHVGAIYDPEEDGGRRLLVLELVEGETLAGRIGQGALHQRLRRRGGRARQAPAGPRRGRAPAEPQRAVHRRIREEIYRRTSLELSYISKDTEDGIDGTCRGNRPEPTPGASCDYFVIANLPEIRKEHEAWMLRFESRPTDRLHLLGSYVSSEATGTIWLTSTALAGSFDIYPYHFVNRAGYLLDHRRHLVKLNGYALLPFDFELGDPCGTIHRCRSR